jgi:hypothetical protein
MFNKKKGENTMHNKRQIIKALSKKAKQLGRKTRLEKVEEMLFGLNVINLMVCRQKRDQGMGFASFETIDAIDKILQNAKMKREERA